jgi:hypothetical protein
MFTDEIRKATIQGVIQAMTGSEQEREEWRASFQDLLVKLEGKITQDEANYLEALVMVLSDANRMTEADTKVPAAFAEDWKTILAVVNHKLTANAAGKSVSLEARQQVMNNTIAVMTNSPERKRDWLQALRGLKADAESNDLPDFVRYTGVLIRLVEGEAHADLNGGVPPVYVGDWETITRSLN